MLREAASLLSLETLQIVAPSYMAHPVTLPLRQILDPANPGNFGRLRGVAVQLEGSAPTSTPVSGRFLDELSELATVGEELLATSNIDLWVGEAFNTEWREVSKRNGRGVFALPSLPCCFFIETAKR